MNLNNFYPKTVYFCNCLKMVIEKCEKGCSLQDLCNEINNNDTGDNAIYCSRCGKGKQDVALSCCDHLAMGSFAIQYIKNNVTTMKVEDGHFCLTCIKTYLRKNYDKFLSKVNI